jgi:hypothetical protein
MPRRSLHWLTVCLAKVGSDSVLVGFAAYNAAGVGSARPPGSKPRAYSRRRKDRRPSVEVDKLVRGFVYPGLNCFLTVENHGQAVSWDVVWSLLAVSGAGFAIRMLFDFPRRWWDIDYSGRLSLDNTAALVAVRCCLGVCFYTLPP